MTSAATCNTCSHFDANHEMCLATTIATPIGPAFSTRTSNSPACWSDYSRKVNPGEITNLFENNRIEASAIRQEQIQITKFV